MLLSNGFRDRECGLGAPSVADQGPQDVDTSAGEGKYGLDVLLPLGAFAVVELPRVRVVADAAVNAPAELSTLCSLGSNACRNTP